MKLVVDNKTIEIDVEKPFVNLFMTDLETMDCVDVYLTEEQFQDLVVMINKTKEELQKVKEGMN